MRAAKFMLRGPPAFSKAPSPGICWSIASLAAAAARAASFFCIASALICSRAAALAPPPAARDAGGRPAPLPWGPPFLASNLSRRLERFGGAWEALPSFWPAPCAEGGKVGNSVKPKAAGAPHGSGPGRSWRTQKVGFLASPEGVGDGCASRLGCGGVGDEGPSPSPPPNLWDSPCQK
eukprot:scaffold1594_cov401-Prasinococcus_capsulatus_cf.AAC.44